MPSNPIPNKPKSPNARQPIFDTVRRLLGRGFRQSEVYYLDDVLDDHIAGTPEIAHLNPVKPSPSVPRILRRKCPRVRRVGKAGTALIKRFEGCARLRRDGLVAAYPDPGTGAEPWTIGWGATGFDDQTGTQHGDRIGPATVWTQAQCDKRLEQDLIHYAQEVSNAIGEAPTTQAQFDALVSFHYNTGAIHRATLTQKHNNGDHKGAAAEFTRWKHAGGRVLKGLVRRRAEEARLYAS